MVKFLHHKNLTFSTILLPDEFRAHLHRKVAELFGEELTKPVLEKHLHMTFSFCGSNVSKEQCNELLRELVDERVFEKEWSLQFVEFRNLCPGRNTIVAVFDAPKKLRDFRRFLREKHNEDLHYTDVEWLPHITIGNSRTDIALDRATPGDIGGFVASRFALTTPHHPNTLLQPVLPVE